MRHEGSAHAVTRTMLAVVADDHSKSDGIELLRAWRSQIGTWTLVATRETGMLIEARLGLDVELVEPGARGGAYQIASLVVSEQVAAVISLSQQTSRGAGATALGALQEACNIHNVPHASNVATAEAVLGWMCRNTHERTVVGLGV